MRIAGFHISTALEAIQTSHSVLQRSEWSGTPDPDDYGLARTLLNLLCQMAERWPPEYFLDDEIELVAEAAELATRIIVDSATEGEYE